MQKKEVLLKISMGSCSKQGVACKKQSQNGKGQWCLKPFKG